MKYVLCFIILVLPITSQAQNAPNTQPIEITADGYFEWRRNEKIFIAKNNARATQGDTSIKAVTLKANYTEGKNGRGMEMHKLTASSNVVITSKNTQALGDFASYNIPGGYAEMTGEDLKLISPDQTLTANDKFEYWINDGKLIAIGNATVLRPKPNGTGTDTLKANRIIVTLKEDQNGNRIIDTMEAKGNVTITTPTETASGTYAIYRKAPNTIEMTGGVKITRGQNILTGNRATVNLNNNTSKIFGNKGTTGQVRGVFYPGSENKNTAPPVPTTPIAPATPTTLTPQKFNPNTTNNFPENTLKKPERPSVQILLPPERN